MFLLDVLLTETMHAALHFAAGFLGLSFALHAGRFVMFAALNFLHQAISVALSLKPAQCFLDGFVVSNLNTNH